MASTFFQMRDELSGRLDRHVTEGGTPSNSTVIHVFRVLMEHGIYSKASPGFGYVAGKAIGTKFIAGETQLNPRSVQRAMKDLERAGWVRREGYSLRLCWVTGSRTPEDR